MVVLQVDFSVEWITLLSLDFKKNCWFFNLMNNFWSYLITLKFKLIKDYNIIRYYLFIVNTSGILSHQQFFFETFFMLYVHMLYVLFVLFASILFYVSTIISN